MVGTMVLWNTSNLPQSFFDPLGQGLERFAKANTDGFDVGVGEHKEVDHVRERFSSDGDTQIFHMGKSGLGTLTGLVPLWKDHFLLWPIHRTPSSNMPLQGPNLCRSIAVWMSLAEQRKQGGPLQGWIAFELFDHPLPIFLERVRTRLPVMRALECRWKLARFFIGAGGALAHPCTCSR